MGNKLIDGIGLCYDDVLIEPSYTEVISRTHVELSTDVGSSCLRYPILSAAMDTVTDGMMAGALAELGCLGVIHRFQSIDERLKQLRIARAISPTGFIGVAIGLKDSPSDCYDLSEIADVIAVDVAHADSKQVLEFVQKLNCCNIKSDIMVGNVATYEATKRFIDLDVDIIKVGIGGGSACTTRMVTGVGVPNVTAIMEARRAVDESNAFVSIIADGGIRSSADIAKALAAGADAVMIGSLFAGADEAPGVKSFDKKVYRGMASNDAQVDFKNGLTTGTVAEGVETWVPYAGPVEKIIEELMGGLRSSFTYCGAYLIQGFYKNARLRQVTPLCLNESKPHIIGR